MAYFCAAIDILTLAVGIGANTLIFSVVNGVLLRSLPYRDSGRIMTLWQQNSKSGAKEGGASPANFFDWRDQNQVFAEMAAAEPYSHNQSEQGEPEAFRSWLVTEGFFHILGVDALLGRTFTSEEYNPGNEHVVVIGYGLWLQRFGADPNLIGQKLRLNGQRHIVVGVMPPEFQFPPERQVWAPRISTDRNSQGRGTGYLPVIGRLKPGVTLAQAQHEMSTIAARLAREYSQVNRDREAMVVPLFEQTVGHVRPALLVLLGAVGLVLLIACANVANLLLVRGAEREREFAIRGALGAGRGRLTRQWLIESCVLALSGALSGIVLAYLGLHTTLALIPNNVPRVAEIGIDSRVLGFTLAVSLLTALIFGLAPALRYTKPDLNETLREGGRGVAGFARHHLRDTQVVSEIALSLILLIEAGLLARSFVRLVQVNPGFTADRVVSLEVNVWGWSRTPEQQAVFFEETLDRLAALPGVEAAGAVSALPFDDNAFRPIIPFTIEGRPVPLPGQEPTADLEVASADYFRALAIPLTRGRFFTRFDRQKASPVALINETLAGLYWPAEDAVGRKITARFYGQVITCEIVGIVGDVRPTGLDSNPRPELFVPLLQSPSGLMTYAVRTADDPIMMLPAVKNEIWAVNKNLPFASVATIEQLVSRSFAARRFNLLLLGSFSVIALTLAGIGIYGLISFSTKQRKQEILVLHGIQTFSSDDVMRFLGRKAHGNFAGEIVSDFKDRPEGIRIKHRVEANSIKAYDKAGSVLRVETTMNDPGDFKVFRTKEGDPNGKADWRKLRRGVADAYRRTQVCQASNQRYLDALAGADTSTPLGELIRDICKPTDYKGKRVRALRPWAEPDLALFAAVSRGEFCVNGFRNRDLQSLLFDHAAETPEEQRRRPRITPAANASSAPPHSEGSTHASLRPHRSWTRCHLCRHFRTPHHPGTTEQAGRISPPQRRQSTQRKPSQKSKNHALVVQSLRNPNSG